LSKNFARSSGTLSKIEGAQGTIFWIRIGAHARGGTFETAGEATVLNKRTEKKAVPYPVETKLWRCSSDRRVEPSEGQFRFLSLRRPAQAGAIEDEAYFQHGRAYVITGRERLTTGRARLGFEVLLSAANFAFARHPDHEGPRSFASGQSSLGISTRRVFRTTMDHHGFARAINGLCSPTANC
jgi:hypothetical protein